MFMGITAHTDAPRVASYAAAESALEKYRAKEATKRRRKPLPENEYPLGGHAKSVTWVRRDDDGKIAFRLYDTDVVTWCPDDSVVIENFGTLTTSGFASRFLPGGIGLNFARDHSSMGRIGNSGIQYRDAADRVEGRASWPYRICQGEHVRFVEDAERGWLPDETTLDPMQFVELDRKAARAATAGLPWKDFEMWLSMAPLHLDIEHDDFRLDDCVTALRDRNFRMAAETLPTVTIPHGWGAAERVKPLNITVADRNKPITMGSIGKLKLAIWEDAGALDVVQRTTVSCGEYARLMARVRELCNLGIGGSYYHMGAS